MPPHDGSYTLFLREDPQPPIREQQDSLRARLERVLNPGALRVEYHPARVPTESDHEVLAFYERVQQWATNAGVSLSPFFEHGETYDPDIEAVRETLSLPVLWLVVTDGTVLQSAYPHVDEAVVPVSTAVSALESPDENAPPGSAFSRPVSNQSSAGRNR